MATLEETLRSLGLSAARGIPQLATGFVDLAALPFTATGLLKPEQAVGSTAYLTSKGLLPPEQQGLLNQTTELVSSAMNPAVATKAALAKGGLLMAAPSVMGSIKPTSGSKEIDALLNKFSSKAESLKLPIEYGSSNVSGSRYLTFKNPEGMDYQIRVSNHGDRYQNQLAGVGERFSIDPESGNTYKDAINWLKEKGINLNKRIKKEPEQTFQQKYNITDEELASLRSRYQNK